MRTVLNIIILLLMTTCSNESLLITDSGVTNFLLGQELNDNYDKSILDITLDSSERIKSIIVKSEKYKTKEGFGVGSSLKEIEDKYNDQSIKKDFNLSKGDAKISKLGIMLIYGNVLFVDSNEDGKVNYVWINEVSGD